MKRAMFGLATLICLTPALWAQDKLTIAAQSEYYPLLPGATWEYKSGTKKITVKVEKLEKVGDETCARLVSEIDDPKEKKTRTEQVTIRKDDGVYRVGYQDSRMEPALCFLKLPAKGTWDIEAKMFNTTLKGKGEVSDKPEKVKVDAGEYDALVCTTTLKAEKNSIKIKYYFVKDIGIVKQEVDFNGNVVTQELVKYTPGK